MSVVTEIDRIKTNIADTYASAEAKGATAPAIKNSDNLKATIESIPAGGGNIDEYFNTIPEGPKFSINSIIKKTPVIDLINCTNMDSAFYGASISSVNLINCQNIISANYAFKDCTNLKDMPNLKLSGVKGMYETFRGSGLTSLNLDISQFAPQCTTFSSVFRDCTNLTSATLKNFNTPCETSGLFGECSKLETVTIEGEAKITDFTQFLDNCGFLRKISSIYAGYATRVYSLFGTGAQYVLTDVGGFIDLGKAYDPAAEENDYILHLDFSRAPKLTHESLMNLINGVYDIKSIGIKPQTLALGSSNLAKLTPEEIALATNKGWNVQ